uniref:Uncharacterized protein n=1 Tax=Hyaloperonospora arabidopsidis (strain Emoy2) TaxID=559515 RepID=M4B5Z0_HYAAE
MTVAGEVRSKLLFTRCFCCPVCQGFGICKGGKKLLGPREMRRVSCSIDTSYAS